MSEMHLTGNFWGNSSGNIKRRFRVNYGQQINSQKIRRYKPIKLCYQSHEFKIIFLRFLIRVVSCNNPMLTVASF